MIQQSDSGAYRLAVAADRVERKLHVEIRVPQHHAVHLGLAVVLNEQPAHVGVQNVFVLQLKLAEEVRPDDEVGYRSGCFLHEFILYALYY